IFSLSFCSYRREEVDCRLGFPPPYVGGYEGGNVLLILTLSGFPFAFARLRLSGFCRSPFGAATCFFLGWGACFLCLSEAFLKDLNQVHDLGGGSAFSSGDGDSFAARNFLFDHFLDGDAVVVGVAFRLPIDG